jgi:hypothetical protein
MYAIMFAIKQCIDVRNITLPVAYGPLAVLHAGYASDSLLDGDLVAKQPTTIITTKPM